MSGQPEYDVFLCHTGADKDWVRGLAQRLEAEKIDGRPMRVFFDDWDIDVGENIVSRVEQGLKASRFLSVVLSPALTRADWPTLEWQSQVYDDPTGRLGRIIPILRHRRDPQTGNPLDIPLPLRLLKWIDFSDDRRFDEKFLDLLRRVRGQRPPRGRSQRAPSATREDAIFQADPDRRQETLWANLLPVERLPEAIWSDLTTAGGKRDVWDASPAKRLPPFAIHGQRLYAFVEPTKRRNPFRRFLTGHDPRRDATQAWLKDADSGRLLIGLFNAALREHCYHLRIHVAKEGTRRRFYCPVFSKPRKFRWGSSARPLTLGVMKQRPDGQIFGVHRAARMAFVLLGERVFLMIEPSYVFTSDGKNPLQGKNLSQYHAAWGGRERNAAVFRSVVMWARLLAGGGSDISIPVGDQSILVRGIAGRADVAHGISGDEIEVQQLFGGAGGGEDDREAEEEMERLAVFEMAGLLDAQSNETMSEDEVSEVASEVADEEETAS